MTASSRPTCRGHTARSSRSRDIRSGRTTATCTRSPAAPTRRSTRTRCRSPSSAPRWRQRPRLGRGPRRRTWIPTSMSSGIATTAPIRTPSSASAWPRSSTTGPTIEARSAPRSRRIGVDAARDRCLGLRLEGRAHLGGADARVTVPDDGYFGEEVAATYDDSGDGWTRRSSSRRSTSSPAGRRGPALELAIGTGRIALPLAARGVPVPGIELSRAMVADSAAKPGATHRWSRRRHDHAASTGRSRSCTSCSTRS